MSMRRACWGLLCVFHCGVLLAAAQSIPPALQDWQGWVLHGHEQQTCPILTAQPDTDATDRQCIWPGHLELTADKTGAHFQLAVHVDAESWVALPGSHDNWPQQVQVGNAPAVVLDHDDAPALRLAAGDYVVQGDFHWDERPARLQLPASIALVDLKVDGTTIDQPERDGNVITLGPPAAQQRLADALSVRVFRRLADGAPPILETRILLHVAGSAREQRLGPALPQGFVATSLDGDLPARLDPDGRLRVQLRPGDWTLNLEARGLAPLGKIRFTPSPAPWPQQEIWSYADAPALRTTRVEGVQPIDPGQANVPQDWLDLPAFVINAGTTLDIEQRGRGGITPDSDRLRLTRELWLDFDGRGLIANDHLQGTLRDADRVDVAAPWKLEQASVGDDDQPLLVTRGDKSGSSGVEVRTRDLDLHAELRRDTHGGTQSATGGWQQTLDNVQATLHLPFGYRLLGAPGADRSPDSWVARWNLLDLFVAALIALLAWRLLGWPWAFVAMGFIVLSHGEPGAPRWTPALALALGLVARALPEGRLRRVAQGAGLAMLALAVLAMLPFGAVQLRDALHPQLEGTSAIAVPVAVEFLPSPPEAVPPPREQTPSAAPEAPSSLPAAPHPPRAVSFSPALSSPSPAPPPPPPADVQARPQTLQTIVTAGANFPSGDMTGYPPDTIVQSGRGVPDWGDFGSSYRLGWSGPVSAQQTWRLVILPAWATRILRVVMLGLLLAWLAGIARAFGLRARMPRRPGRGAAGIASLLLLITSLPQAHAQTIPSQDMLGQLRARLLETPQCMPHCAASPQARVTLQADALHVTIEADAGAQIAFPLPHMDAPATLAGVTLDGKPVGALANRDETTWIALQRGVHRIDMDFRLGGDNAALHFPLPPPSVQVSAPGWQTAGVDGTKLLSDTLTFTREHAAAVPNGAAAPAQTFPPYVKLTRSIAIGLDSRVDNLVTRVSPAQSGFTVDLPLLPGEHVSNAGLKVAQGRVQITFAPGQDEAVWSSTLDAGSSLSLHAPDFGDRAEVWRIVSARLLHLTFSGVPESASDDDTDAASGMRVFRPLPGETLDVHIMRPVAVPGGSIAFDRVTLDVARGEHALDSSLSLQTRSTRGGEQGIELPRDMQWLGAQRDGQTLALNPHDGHVTLPVQPGTQTFTLRFRNAAPIGMSTATPEVALDAPSANIRLSLALPQDRWVLWTWGPRIGPAVLYWAQLVMLLIVAIALARFAPTPLRWWQWLLLGLGFSTFAWSAAVLVALWLIVLGLRARSTRVPVLSRAYFNVVQVAIATLTIVALLCLIAAVPAGLLGRPDMHIAGNASSAWSLHWFADQSDGALPRAGAFTVPLWCYKLAILAWSLWLANALIGWLHWGFHAWMQGGYWKSVPTPSKATLAERIAKEQDDAHT
jgi:hypothetical protein